MKKSILCLLLFLCGAAAVRAADRALIVGTDIYSNIQIDGTPGAADDARAMQRLLVEKMNFPAGSVKMLINEQATAANIVQTFQTWLIDGTRPGDRVFFSYAGHGFQAPDDNGDEQDGLDEVITPYDIAIASQGGKVVLPNEKTFIRDDKFNDFIAKLSGRRAVLLFDSCHSGTISRGISAGSTNLPSRYLRVKPGQAAASRGIGDYSYVPPAGKTRDLAVIREESVAESVNGVVVFSAASPYQQAFPIEIGAKTRGAFSYLFESLLSRDPSEKLSSLQTDLQREMKILADKGYIGKSQNGEFQVPQIDILSKTNLSDKPLFAVSSSVDDYTAAAESALFNPLSTMRVRLALEKNRYKYGDTINYGVDVGELSYLYILVFSTNNVATCIFPSATAGDTINYVKPGNYTFPRGDYVTEAQAPAGKDVWVALVSKKKLPLGEKEAYTWDEMFSRIGLAELQKAISENVTKQRGAGNRKTVSLTATDWQASTVVVETVEK